MRGKLHRAAADRLAARIIPAHAGQTRAPPTRFRLASDHPRACGANFQALPGKIGGFGSSPRMRGKPVCKPCTYDNVRIIPAHAGQTLFCHLLSFLLPDHPRACGANVSAVVPVGATIGSSPRMRGKQQRGGDIRAARRIIPAHAGQTRPAPNASTPPPDHPRACGANV